MILCSKVNSDIPLSLLKKKSEKNTSRPSLVRMKILDKPTIDFSF